MAISSWALRMELEGSTDFQPAGTTNFKPLTSNAVSWAERVTDKPTKRARTRCFINDREDGLLGDLRRTLHHHGMAGKVQKKG